MNSSTTPALRRLNGRLQACDPCRSRKVACDHTRPVCLRCHKRKQDRHCVYTVSSTTVNISAAESASPLSAQSRQDEAASSLEVSGMPSTIPEKRSALNDLAQARRPITRTIGYMGFTSYSTVIEETVSILNDLPELRSGSPCLDDCPVSVSPSRLAMGVTILRRIPSLEEAEQLFQVDSAMYNKWIRLTAREILRPLYSIWGKYLGPDRSVAKLEEMALKVCINTAKPVVNKAEVGDWLGQFCGANLRWESLGLIFTALDFGLKFRGTHVFQGPVPHVQCPVALHESIALCLELSQEFSDGTIFTVFLSHRRLVLESLASGDASRQTWRYLADTVANLTFLGMHAEPRDASYQPTYFSEASRRILLPIFTVDKVQLAFTGRPPLLIRKFVTTPMPLDLSDEDLFLDQASLVEKARSSLDERGWNKDGKLYPTTGMRARYMLAQINEQIAEVALGNEAHATIDDLLKIKRDQDAVVAGFPQALVWRQADMVDLEDPSIFISKVLVRLEALQNDFFLYRLLLRKGSPDEGHLLLTSFQMVSVVLTMWTNKDRFVQFSENFAWLLMGFGASPGGILCKCLLKSTSSRVHPSDPSITRSAIIQKLSLLVGFLDWVSPTAPNAELCKDCKSVIERVLDQALNNIPGETSSVLDGPSWDFSAPLDFNFDLMDTFDWLRTDYATVDVPRV